MSQEHGHPLRSDGSQPAAPPLGPRARWKSPDEPEGVWDVKRNVQRLLYVLYAICTLLVALDLVVVREVHHPWEQLVAFHAWYGFASCWILVLVAKRLRRVLMRSDDHYNVD